ncbi:MAG: PAS domain-containing protein, partial [Halalkalicoccus sp.]
HPDEREAYVADYLAAVVEQRAWSNQNRLRRHDGEWRWFDNHAQPLFDADGAYQGHVGVTMDITEQKEREERLRESEARLKRLNDASREVIDATTQEITDRIPTLVRTVLGVEHAVFWKYDEAVGELTRCGSAPEAEIDPEIRPLPDGIDEQAWQTFLDDGIQIESSVSTPTDGSGSTTGFGATRSSRSADTGSSTRVRPTPSGSTLR